MDNSEETAVIYRETTKRFWVLRLLIEVRNDGLYVKLIPFHRRFRHIAATDIADVTVTTYSPATYGGWHWGAQRSPQGDTVYRLRGKTGVEFVLAEGMKIFVGSQSPTQLAAAAERVI